MLLYTAVIAAAAAAVAADPCTGGEEHASCGELSKFMKQIEPSDSQGQLLTMCNATNAQIAAATLNKNNGARYRYVVADMRLNASDYYSTGNDKHIDGWPIYISNSITYVFNVSHSTNAGRDLNFTTGPGVSVTRNGTAGQPGATVDLIVGTGAPNNINIYQGTNTAHVTGNLEVKNYTFGSGVDRYDADPDLYPMTPGVLCPKTCGTCSTSRGQGVRIAVTATDCANKNTIREEVCGAVGEEWNRRVIIPYEFNASAGGPCSVQCSTQGRRARRSTATASVSVELPIGDAYACTAQDFATQISNDAAAGVDTDTSFTITGVISTGNNTCTPSTPDYKPLNDTTFHDAVAAMAGNNTQDEQVVTAYHGPIELWDTSQVTSMRQAFKGYGDFNPNISAWDTGEVTDMYEMFRGASSFNGDLGTWQTSKVNTMRGMFTSAKNFTGVGLENWDTGEVTDMGNMFGYASSFDGNVSTWDTGEVTDMSFMFRGTGFDGDLRAWQTSKVNTMMSMFTSAKNFTGVGLENWDTGQVKNMQNMFYGASSFNGNVSTWNTGQVTDMSFMFEGASSFAANLSCWQPVLESDNKRPFPGDSLLPAMSACPCCQFWAIERGLVSQGTKINPYWDATHASLDTERCPAEDCGRDPPPPPPEGGGGGGGAGAAVGGAVGGVVALGLCAYLAYGRPGTTARYAPLPDINFGAD